MVMELMKFANLFASLAKINWFFYRNSDGNSERILKTVCADVDAMQMSHVNGDETDMANFFPFFLTGIPTEILKEF